MKLLALLKHSPGRIRTRLFRDLVLVVLFATGTLLLVNYLLVSEVREELAWTKISRAMLQVKEEVRRLLEPVEQQLKIARARLRDGELRFSDPPQLTGHFIPALRYLPQISGLVIADEGGAEYFLLRDGGHWRSRQREGGDSGLVTWQRWDTDGRLMETWEENLDYDPRERPWFKEALAALPADEITWSEPYVFFSRQVPGVTAAAAWPSEATGRVVAIDVELGKILDTIDDLQLGQGGKAILFRADGGVFVPPGEQANAASTVGRVSFFSANRRLGGALAFDAVSAWERKRMPTDRAVQFISEDVPWWGGFAPLYAGEEGAWLGVALPVEGLFEVLQKRWTLVLTSALGVLGAGVFLALVLVRKYSRQLKDLPKLSIAGNDYENDLYDLIRSGESSYLEFKSTMRMNLRSGKPGKEIELSWLKGVVAFMNSDGGILLIGVDDDGNLLGLEADQFESEDKCRLHFKNLFNQHIGPEFSKFVRMEIYALEGKQLVAIECERSADPVFLHRKNQSEAFYIRSGPSNIDLSVRQALKYLQSRF